MIIILYWIMIYKILLDTVKIAHWTLILLCRRNKISVLQSYRTGNVHKSQTAHVEPTSSGWMEYKSEYFNSSNKSRQDVNEWWRQININWTEKPYLGCVRVKEPTFERWNSKTYVEIQPRQIPMPISPHHLLHPFIIRGCSCSSATK